MPPNHSRKAQMGLMEYIILTLFIAIVIIALIFFLVGFQIGQYRLEKSGSLSDAAFSLTKRIASSPLLVKEDSVFDDGKLTALTGLGNACQRLEPFFGADWFFEVVPAGNATAAIPCTPSSYPDCNVWSFCTQAGKNAVAFDLPVNVYRNLGTVLSTGVVSRTDLALLRVGLYVS